MAFGFIDATFPCIRGLASCFHQRVPLLTRTQCNGQKPCQTCAKKQLSCLYGSTEDGLDRNEVSSPKRRMVEIERMVESPSNTSTNGSLNQSSPYGLLIPSPQISQTHSGVDNGLLSTGDLQNGDSKSTAHLSGMSPARREESKQISNVPNANPNSVSGAGSVSDDHEEADVYNYTRMLQDPSGRLCKLFTTSRPNLHPKASKHEHY